MKFNLPGNETWFFASSEAIKVQPVASGLLESNSYRLSLRIHVDAKAFQPFFRLYIRSHYQDKLPTDVSLKYLIDDIWEDISTCSALPIYSIIHKDYVSCFDFTIEEKFLLRLFQERGKLLLIFNKQKEIIVIKNDDSLSYIQIKEQLAPKHLSEEQRVILHQERQRQAEKEKELAEQEAERNRIAAEKKAEERRIAEEKKAKEAEQKRLAEEKEKEKQREEKRKNTAIKNWEKEQVAICSKLLVPILIRRLHNGSETDYSRWKDGLYFEFHGRTIKDYIKEEISIIIIDSLNTNNENYIKEKTKIINTDSFVNKVVNFLITKKIITEIEHISRFVDPDLAYFSSRYVISKELSERQALDLFEEKAVRIVKSKIMDEENEVQLIKDVKDLVKELWSDINTPLETRRTDLYCIRQIYNTVKNYYLYYNGEPTIVVKKLGLNLEYIVKQLELLKQRGLIDYDLGVAIRVTPPNFYRNCSLEQLYDIIDQKTSVNAIKSATKATPSANGGCYIATCVYGSYDCPEVWTLRRYRDNVLQNSWAGRLFIQVYYAVSPKLVKWLGPIGVIKSCWKYMLDRIVHKLQNAGFDNSSYTDN